METLFRWYLTNFWEEAYKVIRAWNWLTWMSLLICQELIWWKSCFTLRYSALLSFHVVVKKATDQYLFREQPTLARRDLGKEGLSGHQSAALCRLQRNIYAPIEISCSLLCFNWENSHTTLEHLALTPTLFWVNPTQGFVRCEGGW